MEMAAEMQADPRGQPNPAEVAALVVVEKLKAWLVAGKVMAPEMQVVVAEV